MESLMIGILCIGVILVVVGIAFIFPSVVVSRLSATTKGSIKGITYNANSYNVRVAQKIGDLKEDEKKGKIRIRTGVGTPYGVGGNSKKMYHSIYFYTVNGVEYSRADGPGYNRGIAEKKIGKEVIVHYNPENPLKASLSSGMVYKILSGTFILLGLIITIVGIVLF